MKLLPILLLPFALLFSNPSTLNAQKIGHVDYSSILEKLPDVKRADADIENTRTALGKQAENLQKKIQAKYQEAMDKATAGTLTPAEEEQYTQLIQKMQEDLEKFTAKAETDLATKRNTLLKPILDKIENAVKAVAQEKGFAYIFDVSTLLYTGGGTDCTADVKGKLGVQ